MRPKTALIILNYRNSEDTITCVRSLIGSGFAPAMHIIVIDNASNDGSAEVLTQLITTCGLPSAIYHEEARPDLNELRARISLICSKKNGGYAAGNNLGLRLALRLGAKYSIILNNDTVPTLGALSTMIQYADLEPRAGIVGPKIIKEDGRIDRACARRRPRIREYFLRTGATGLFLRPLGTEKSHYYEGEYEFESIRQVDLVSGSCLLIRMSVLEQIGFLDEGTFLYFEEAIIHERLRRTGYYTLIVPEATVIHRGQQSTKLLSSLAVGRHHKNSLKHYLSTYRGVSGPLLSAILLNFTLGLLIQVYSRKVADALGKH